MFSYDDRLRAVQLYIKLGKRAGLTIRQLGYPTKNALLSWHREYEQRLDLPAGYVRQPRYSQAHKELAVRHYSEHGRCIAATISASMSPLAAEATGLRGTRLISVSGPNPEVVAVPFSPSAWDA